MRSEIYCEYRNEMAIWHKRVLFTELLGKFINEAFKRGYKIALDEVKARDGHRENSLHYLGLAADYVIYTDQGDYLKSTKDYIALDCVWESLHPDAFSGMRFNDGNHISLSHDGRK